jgi:hypothetical protein
MVNLIIIYINNKNNVLLKEITKSRINNSKMSLTIKINNRNNKSISNNFKHLTNIKKKMIKIFTQKRNNKNNRINSLNLFIKTQTQKLIRRLINKKKIFKIT